MRQTYLYVYHLANDLNTSPPSSVSSKARLTYISPSRLDSDPLPYSTTASIHPKCLAPKSRLRNRKSMTTEHSAKAARNPETLRTPHVARLALGHINGHYGTRGASVQSGRAPKYADMASGRPLRTMHEGNGKYTRDTNCNIGIVICL
jgi:hypothetical protein